MKITSSQIENYLLRIANEKIAGCLVYGPEAIVVRARVEIIAKKIVKDLSDGFLVSNLSEEKLEIDNALLADEFYSMAMFGGRKLIIIKDASTYTAQALKALVANKDYAKKSDNFILIQADDLSKTSALRKIAEDNPSLASIACYEDSEQVIRQFIIDNLKQKNLKFNLKIVDLFLEKFGKNRQLIALEIEKISQYFASENNLESEALAQMLVDQSEISINQFVSSFADQNFSMALKHANKLLSGDFEAIGLIRILSIYIQKLYHAKLALEQGGVDFETIIRQQNLFFKAQDDFRRHLKKLSLNFLIKILGDLEENEIKVKTSKMSPKLVITSYITSLVAQKNNL
ncbi:MAG: DNA polymerase III subunit delta [Alphaproteobacteria bacterium]